MTKLKCVDKLFNASEERFGCGIKMGLSTNQRREFSSPMMRIGETFNFPDNRPRTSIRRPSASKRLINSADFPVSRQSIRTSIGGRQFSKFNYDNQKKVKQINHVSFQNPQETDASDNESQQWCNIRRRISSKDIVHHLLEEWVPQLCENYRPFVYYEDHDDTISVVTVTSERSDKNGISKLHAAEHAIDACRHLQNRRPSHDFSSDIGVS